MLAVGYISCLQGFGLVELRYGLLLAIFSASQFLLLAILFRSRKRVSRLRP